MTELTAVSAQKAIPAGRFEISEDADRMVRITSGAPPGDGIVAHPIFAFLAAVGGLGMRIGDVLAMGGGAIDQGPVLAACALRFHRPLRVGRIYDVFGRLIEVRRKPSQRFGQSDHFLLHFALADAGADHAELELRIIVPATNERKIAE